MSKFKKISDRKFLVPFDIPPPEFYEFSVEWFSFQKFDNFRFFRKRSKEISVPFTLVSEVLEFLVQWQTPLVFTCFAVLCLYNFICQLVILSIAYFCEQSLVLNTLHFIELSRLIFQLTKLRPDKPFGYYQLAKCLDEIGDKDGARTARHTGQQLS